MRTKTSVVLGGLFHHRCTAILRTMFSLSTRCRTMFNLAEQVLQHDVTASIQILRNTPVYVISMHGPWNSCLKCSHALPFVNTLAVTPASACAMDHKAIAACTPMKLQQDARRWRPRTQDAHHVRILMWRLRMFARAIFQCACPLHPPRVLEPASLALHR